jgi:hypothetical protein
MSDPRWLDLTAASAYLSLRPDIFARKVREGIVPAPSLHLGERTPRWDRGMLDAAMGGGTGSTNAREAVNALAEEIAGEGRKNGSPRAQGRHGQGLHLRTSRTN